MYNKKIPIDLNCGFRIAIEVIGGKWKPYIVYELLSGPKEISTELDFPNLSFFGKFVKAHLGMAPTEYRQKNLKEG